MKRVIADFIIRKVSTTSTLAKDRKGTIVKCKQARSSLYLLSQVPSDFFRNYEGSRLSDGLVHFVRWQFVRLFKPNCYKILSVGQL